MRWRLTAIGCALGGGAIVAGCIDLFHSTDFDTACSLDAAACTTPPGGDGAPDGTVDGQNGGDGQGPGDDGANDGGSDGAADTTPPRTDFCDWPRTKAHDMARRACAWLGACEGTVGNNSFGVCFDNAVRAYDCQLNPNMKVVGRTFNYWNCLSQVTSCTDVASCVGNQGLTCPPKALEYGGCGAGASAAIHLDCPAEGGAPISAETCAAVGQTCLEAVGCVGTTTTCTTSQCLGNTQLRDCFDPGSGVVDVGVDCLQFGGGRCTNTGDAGPACVPDGGIACTPTATIVCNGGTATGCPTGNQQVVDCLALMEDGGMCTPSGAGRPWDVSRACQPTTTVCSSGGCSNGGAVLVGCHRGQPVTVSCASVGLGACQPSPRLGLTDYACTKP